MFEPSVKFSNDVWTKVKRVADAAGYSSPQEFVLHVLEREIAKLDDAESNEEIVRKLRGLGYID